MHSQEHILQYAPVGLMLFEKSSKGWTCEYASAKALEMLPNARTAQQSIESVFSKGITKQLEAGTAIEFYESQASKWLLLQSHLDDARMTVALSDVTAQKEVAISDVRLLNLYKTLSSALADNEIVLFDKDFNILFTEGNPRFIRVDAGDTLLGRNFSELVSASKFSFLKDYLQDVFSSSRKDVEQEVEGSFYHFSLYAQMRDEQLPDNNIGILLIKDVTEINRKQRELLSLHKRIQRSNKDLEEFAYTASHDLQAPLRKIQSFSRLLTDRYSDALTGNGLVYLKRMNDAAQHMEALLNDLLLYSRASRKGDGFELTDILSILKRVISDVSVNVNAEVNIHSPEELMLIDAIPTQIHQLFQNLVENAIKFTKPGASPVLDIRVAVKKGKDITDEHLPDEADYCVIEFADQGIGFDQENAERIFQIFQRLHGLSEYTGSGLGLAICKKIADTHNGFINAHAEIEKGATFTVILPVKQTEENEAH